MGDEPGGLGKVAWLIPKPFSAAPRSTITPKPDSAGDKKCPSRAAPPRRSPSLCIGGSRPQVRWSAFTDTVGDQATVDLSELSGPCGREYEGVRSDGIWRSAPETGCSHAVVLLSFVRPGEERFAGSRIPRHLPKPRHPDRDVLLGRDLLELVNDKRYHAGDSFTFASEVLERVRAGRRQHAVRCLLE